MLGLSVSAGQPPVRDDLHFGGGPPLRAGFRAEPQELAEHELGRALLGASEEGREEGEQTSAGQS